MVETSQARMGTGGSPPKTGLFIRDFLRDVGESYASEIHRNYKALGRNWKTLSGARFHPATYNSFAAYLSKLVLAGLVERTGNVESSDDPRAAVLTHPERVYLRLTLKGEGAPDLVWMHPLRIWYYPLDWEKVEYADYVKPPKRRVIRRRKLA